MAEGFVSLSAPRDDELSLLELADRLLYRGVVVSGEATISVAGVDLIYLGLYVVLTAVSNLKKPPATGQLPVNSDATPPPGDIFG
jgi:hypothetical protein